MELELQMQVQVQLQLLSHHHRRCWGIIINCTKVYERHWKIKHWILKSMSNVSQLKWSQVKSRESPTTKFLSCLFSFDWSIYIYPIFISLSVSFEFVFVLYFVNYRILIDRNFDFKKSRTISETNNYSFHFALYF